MPAVPLNKVTLDWALREAGLNSDAVADSLKVDPEQVEAWLAGDSEPTTTKARSLAKLVGRSVQFLLTELEDPKSQVPAAFRRPPNLEQDPLSSNELSAVRDARRTQDLLRWIAQESNQPVVQLPTARIDDSAVGAASEARDWLGWTTEIQLEAASSSASTKLLRRAIEDKRIAVLHYQMDDEGYRGFSMVDSRAPLIAVNTKQRVEARAFTYAHELGHLVLGSEEVCKLYPASGVEGWCDRFAGTFLLEEEPLRKYVDRRCNGFVGTVEQLRTVANKFNISMSATAIRLKDLELASAGLYHAIDRSVDLGKSSGGGPGGEPNDRPRLRFLKYGSTVARAIDRALEDGRLQRTDALSHLKLNKSELQTVFQLTDREAS